MPYKPMCGHKWVERGNALVCEWCDALGYKKDAAPGATRLQEKIYVYLCSKKGCREPAVTLRMTRMFCRRHAK